MGVNNQVIHYDDLDEGSHDGEVGDPQGPNRCGTLITFSDLSLPRTNKTQCSHALRVILLGLTGMGHILSCVDCKRENEKGEGVERERREGEAGWIRSIAPVSHVSLSSFHFQLSGRQRSDSSCAHDRGPRRWEAGSLAGRPIRIVKVSF